MSKKAKQQTIAHSVLPAISLLDNNVLLRITPPKPTTDSGIWYPAEAARRADEAHRGTVVACGPGRYLKYGTFEPVEVQPGDDVMFYFIAHKARTTRWPTSRHLIIPEDYIQLVFER